MNKEPETGPSIKMLASRMAEVTEKVDFIGRDGKPYQRDYEADAKWFVARHLAEEMMEVNTIKDWAHVILGGIRPLDDKTVQEYLVEGTPTDDELLRWFL